MRYISTLRCLGFKTKYLIFFACLFATAFFAVAFSQNSNISVVRVARGYQVLGNDGEFWIFIDVAWYRRSRNPFRSAPVTLLQETYVFKGDQKGVVLVSHLGPSSPKSMVSVHPNLGKIFHWKGTFYLYYIREGKLYKWNGSRFVATQSSEVIQLQKSKEISKSQSFSEIYERLDLISLAEGWKFLDESAMLIISPHIGSWNPAWQWRDMHIRILGNNAKTTAFAIAKKQDRLIYKVKLFNVGERTISYRELKQLLSSRERPKVNMFLP